MTSYKERHKSGKKAFPQSCHFIFIQKICFLSVYPVLLDHLPWTRALWAWWTKQTPQGHPDGAHSLVRETIKQQYKWVITNSETFHEGQRGHGKLSVIAAGETSGGWQRRGWGERCPDHPATCSLSCWVLGVWGPGGPGRVKRLGLTTVMWSLIPGQGLHRMGGRRPQFHCFSSFRLWTKIF